MGFLDKAKKLAEQVKVAAEDVKGQAEKALNQAQNQGQSQGQAAPPPPAAPAGASPRASMGGSLGGAPAPGTPDAGRPSAGRGSGIMGTAYVPGMLGRPGWRERGLVDPAAVLPAAERDQVGVPRTTKSVILQEPFGMGRRWSSGGRSTALFYQLYPDQQAWLPPGGRTPVADVNGASAAALPDGRSLVFLGTPDLQVVLETTGLDDAARATLARTVATQLQGV